VSTYAPRECGLATYTADLYHALEVATDDLTSVVVAIDRGGLDYGTEVIATIDQDTPADYREAAETLHRAGVNVVLIQHEYGIFGGDDGAHVLHLTRSLNRKKIPYVVTLHTVLSRPSRGQAETLRALCAGAARVTVFTETARRIAIRTGVAAGSQLLVMPHGAPVIMRTPPNPTDLRDEIADLIAHVAGKPTLTTFGLLSRGKGIDIGIEALAQVVHRHPEVQYVVAGKTHPEVQRHEGEAYRHRLKAQVTRLGLEKNVHFIDAFLDLDELSAILNASTVFLTPYRSPEQACSGALTFALAAGLPAVSSAYRYAQDMLADGAGRVVPCGDVDSLAVAINELLGDRDALNHAQSVAQSIADWLPWPSVAAREADLFRDVVARARRDGRRRAHPAIAAPPLNLAHLDRLTDEIGIIQFATLDAPEPSSGYCVDDVARVAVVAAEILAVGRTPASHDGALANRWLRDAMRFLAAAYHPSGAMHNILSYQGTWEDEPHIGDHVGRAMWGLGVLVNTAAVPDDIRRSADELLGKLAVHTPAHVAELGDVGLRSAVYALLGLAKGGHREAAAPLVELLDRKLRETSAEDPGWRWFEPTLTYDNARLPQALLAGAALTGDTDAAARALSALEWYADHVRLTTGTLRCVGNVWHRRDDDPALWLGEDGDEQPLDAAALAEALGDAWAYSGDAEFAKLATLSYEWFLGRNRAGERLYVDATGACHDGLGATWVNGNQGAESTLAYYQALLSLVRVGLVTLAEPAVSSRNSPGLSIGREIVRGNPRRTAPPTKAAPLVGAAGASSAAGAATLATPPTMTTPPTKLTARRTRPTEGHTDAR